MRETNLISFNELPSTNSYALRNIDCLNDRGTIFAKIQTEGRGRLNRSWVSNNPNNLYFSIVLKPTDKINNNLPLANLTQYMSVVICKLIEEYGITAQIKWPNDVLINNKKIAGILAESSIVGTKLKGIVLGVGINLNSTQEEMSSIDQPATSLNLETQKNINPEEFLEELTERFFQNYDNFLEIGFDMIKTDYLKRCCFIDKNIKINDFNGIYDAVAKGINDDGSLCIEKNSQREDIRIGDILC